ncbi:hypothetical protein J4760_09815 [Salinicoccus sp. ID82-1]|uniref:hypothetical protein n=1 Tax=Salinicoccus sp. ID82-1 TaxID=2820269 RepID=UPI001F3FA0F6|nr:hypothetical protein [Salinicoccus sp. ID82-1]MCG1010312.1 hypothetical protein [Salinicoccus sp. ID82-1]
MKKYIIIGILIVAVGVGIYFVFGNSQEREAHEIQPARITGDQFEVKTPDGWEQMTIKGVNMGMAKPGYFPGEAAITEDEYYRWFEQIGEMNANTVRVYTLHPPGFYNALARYNDRNEENIYIMHGLWADEGKMHDGLDAFDEALNEEFNQDMMNVMDAIHGGGTVEPEPGKASGDYTKDVSGYVIGWIMGVEWYPPFVVGTNEKHDDIGQYDGTFYRTEDASPFEHWLAEKMDYISKYENETYGSLRPMSFTNWVTTDILEHPSDSSDMEDLVSVDPNVIYTEGEMEDIGQYASYHIYPYYPDFLNYDKKYVEYTDHRGEKNNYAGYLNEMVAEHRLPILVAEFGVPASRGLTHRNPFGWDQGFHTEEEQGEIVTHLYEDILEEGMLGGLIFTWQDEWFKRTWNTMDYDDPDRRPFWSNAQTNEQQFGLLSFDTHKIKVDGDGSGWEGDPLYTGSGVLESLTMDHDERYLYLKVEHDPEMEGGINIPLDVIDGQGNHTLNGQIESEDGIDFLIDINSEQSRVTVDDYYDFFEIQYGHTLEMIDAGEAPEMDSGEFNPIRLALNKEYYLPDRGVTLPFESYETGLLREGIGDPEAESYDSLTDYNWNREEGVLEIRLPWQLIGARDPSQREFIGNIAEDGLEASVHIDGIGVGAYVTDDRQLVDSLPAVEAGRLPALDMYTWEEWDMPESEERLKKSYDIIKETFSE